MSKMFILILFSLLFQLPTVAYSLNCSQPENTLESNACAQQSYEAADGDLNFTWKSMTRDLDRTVKRNLLQAQRTWIKFRDLHCTAEASVYAGGSMANMIHLGCLERMTRNRTEELRTMLESN